MKEFVDFLAARAPYDALDPDDLLRLAVSVEAEYFPSGATLVRAGAEPLRHLCVLRAGAVDVLDRGRRVDQLRVGDTFGHISLFSGSAPTLSVVAARDTLIYRLADPRGLLRHPERLRFAPYGLHAGSSGAADPRSGPAEDRALRPASALAREVVLVSADTPVHRVAALIGEHRQSCAVVGSAAGLGIVTDADFRARLGSGEVGVDDPVELITSRPALTVADRTPLAAALTEMVRHGVHHLVLTGPDGGPTGVVRVVDLASAEVRDPLVLRATVAAATDRGTLARAVRLLDPTTVLLSDDGVPAARVVALHSAVLDAALARLLALARPVVPDGLVVPDGPVVPDGLGGHRWLALGALGRHEALPGSTPRLVGIVPPAGDLGSSSGPATSPPTAPASALAEMLAEAGLGPAPGDGPVVRSGPQWRALVAGWIEQGGPEAAAALADLIDARPVGTGPVQDWLDGPAALLRTPPAVALLLGHATGLRPPTGFVADEVVLADGGQADRLDLSGAVLAPLVALGRWAAAAVGDLGGTTSERLRRAGAAGLLTDLEAGDLVGAHDQVLARSLAVRVAALRAGSAAADRVAVGDLDDADRRLLRQSFHSVAAVQDRLTGRPRA